jgi:hypothetical protein
MKYLLLTIVLMLDACDGSSTPAPQSPPTPKIAAPQREALEKAKGVEQTLQQENEAAQKKLSEAEGK